MIVTSQCMAACVVMAVSARVLLGDLQKRVAWCSIKSCSYVIYCFESVLFVSPHSLGTRLQRRVPTCSFALLVTV